VIAGAKRRNLLRECLMTVRSGYEHVVRMVMTCAEPGCSTLALGRLCIEHEPKTTQAFVRGRPWPPVARPLTINAAGSRATSVAGALRPLQAGSLVDT
jgi:hypothetical protein